MSQDGELRLWKWTEIPRFARDCQAIADATGVPYEHDFDLIRDAIHMNICRNPLAGQTRPDPRFLPPDEERRVFRTARAPAQIQVAPLVVTYRVVSYPQFGRLGIIEGREVWLEDELRKIGYTVLANVS